MLFASESSGDFISALLSSCRLVLENKWLYAKMVWKLKGLLQCKWCHESMKLGLVPGVLVLILVWSCFYRQPGSWAHLSLVTVGTPYFIFLLPTSDQFHWLHVHVTEHLPPPALFSHSDPGLACAWHFGPGLVHPMIALAALIMS